jgi:Fe2+ or Zn2+ uptake regulation protein
MTANDDSILEFLAEHDLALPPGAIHYNLQAEGVEISYATVNRRLKRLLRSDLVAKAYEEGGYYVVTAKGRAYLAGELAPAELREEEEEEE